MFNVFLLILVLKVVLETILVQCKKEKMKEKILLNVGILDGLENTTIKEK